MSKLVGMGEVVCLAAEYGMHCTPAAKVARRGRGVHMHASSPRRSLQFWYRFRPLPTCRQARDVLLALHRLCAPTLDLHLLLFSASRPPTTSGALPLPSANGFIPAPATLGNGPSPASAPPLNEEVLVSFLLRCAAEQSSGQFFNLAHSVNALQVRMRTQGILGATHCKPLPALPGYA